MEDKAQSAADKRSQITRKTRDLVAILPLLGVIFFATPLISAITGGEEDALPSAALYIFAVWGGLIVLAFVLSRLLRTEADQK